MSEKLSPRRVPKGTDGAKLHKWVAIFLIAGVVGRSILELAMLGMNTLTGDELYAWLEANPGSMWILTAALACKVMQSCAAPLVAFLLVEGFLRTSGFEKYLVRIAALAVVTELPYNLAVEGQILHLGTRNPVFGLAIGLVMLYFFSRFEEKSLRNILMKLLIFVAAFLWCRMLRIEHGGCLVILVGILWLSRSKSNLRSLYGFCGCMVCTVLDPYYIGACLACIMFHRYNEEKGEQNRAFNYAFYPVCLLIAGIAAKFL